jgi:uncharacterized protein (TIGR01777 family)
MNIVVTGGMGFTGRAVCRRLLDLKHTVTAIGYRVRENEFQNPNFYYLAADTTRSGSWQDVLGDADGIVNLTGRSIFKRWTKRYKQTLRDSRIMTTRNLVDGLSAPRKPVLLSTSAIGYYGDGGETVLTESHPSGDDFLAQLALDWEAEARKAEAKGIRVGIMRFAVVLDAGGGALASMLPPFRMGAGGPIGHGRQWFSWIHMEDLVSAVVFLLQTEPTRGAYNFTAPQPVRNRDLARGLGKVLRRPALIPVPGLALKLAMGEFGGTLLASQRVVPEGLEQAGFRFRYPDLESALKDLLLAG